MTDYRYIVIRKGPNVPEDFNIGDLEGKWFDKDNLPFLGYVRDEHGSFTAKPNGKIEKREDGAIAAVYEVQPT